MLCVRRLAVALTASLLVAACSDDSTTSYNPADLTVDTGVSALVVPPGQPFDVTCTVTHVTDGVVDVGTTVLIEPVDGATIVDHTVTPTRVGSLTVTCALTSAPEVYDPTPETVLVTQNAAAGVETVLEPSQIGAGSTSNVRCQPFNQQGAKVEAPTTVTVSPTAGIQLADHTITGEAVGSYEVTCALTDAPSMKDNSPATLKVVAGPAAKVTTTLDNASAPAGTTATVACAVEDAYGNPVTDAVTQVTASPSEGVTIADHTLSAGKTGSYEITCHVADKTDATEVPASLEVTGGKAVKVDLVVDPVKQGYAIGDEVTFSWTVEDTFGNVLDVPATFEAPTAGVKKTSELTYELTGEGQHTFTVSLDAPNTGVFDSETLMVDATPPTLIITWPPRGQTLTGDQAVVVTGEVSDAVSGLDILRVNGTKLTPEPDGTFKFTVQAQHGLNAVLAEADDEAGNHAKATVAFYFSSDYMPYVDTTPADVALEDALRLFLGQDVIDDNDHDPSHVDDLATLVEILLANVDLTQLGLGQLFEQTVPVINQSLGQFDILGQSVELNLTGDAVIKVTISEVALSSKPTVHLTSKDGGIFFQGELPQVNGAPGLSLTLTVSVALKLKVAGQLQGLDLISGEVTPTLLSDTTASIQDVSFSTMIGISKAAGQPLVVNAQGLVPKMTGLAIAPLDDTYIDLGNVVIKDAFGLLPPTSVPLGQIDLNALVGPIGDLLGNFATPLLDTLVPLLAQLLGPVLDGPASQAIASALESVQIDQAIDLPELLGNGGGSITLDAGLSTVAFTTTGGKLGLRSGAWSEKDVDYDPLGALLRDACLGGEPGQFAFTEQLPMSVALHLDLINELLHAVWWNGFLDMAGDEASLAGLSQQIVDYGVKDLVVTALLPPVLTDCGGKGLLRLQLGDLFVQVKANLLGLDVDAEMFVSIELDANIKAQGSELGITVNGVTLFQVEIVKVNESFKGNEAALEEAIKALLLPQIEKLAEGSLGNFPIPALDLSGVVPGIPAGTSIQLGDLAVGKSKGYITLDGDLK